MLSHSDLKKGVIFILEKHPYEVLQSSSVFKGRGSSVNQVKVKDLITGNVLSKTLHTGEEFEEAEIKKTKAKFLYSHKGKFVFCKEEDPSQRFDLSEDAVAEKARFLKPNGTLDLIEFEEKIINISLPVKVCLKVAEAPPGVKGDRAQGGNKVVTLETGAKINAPLFVEEGDFLEINTEREEYVRRIK